MVVRYEFDNCVNRYRGNYKIRDFSGWNQFLCMMFGQITHRESIRDIATCLKAHQNKVYHLGIKQALNILPPAQYSTFGIYQPFRYIATIQCVTVWNKYLGIYVVLLGWAAT